MEAFNPYGIGEHGVDERERHLPHRLRLAMQTIERASCRVGERTGREGIVNLSVRVAPRVEIGGSPNDIERNLTGYLGEHRAQRWHERCE